MVRWTLLSSPLCPCLSFPSAHQSINSRPERQPSTWGRFRIQRISLHYFLLFLVLSSFMSEGRVVIEGAVKTKDGKSRNWNLENGAGFEFVRRNAMNIYYSWDPWHAWLHDLWLNWKENNSVQGSKTWKPIISQFHSQIFEIGRKLHLCYEVRTFDALIW